VVEHNSLLQNQEFAVRIEFRVAMTPEDLGRSNLEALGKQWA